MASDFHHKIENDSKKIEQLFHLIDILGHTDLSVDDDLKVLETLDIPIVKNGQLSISEEDIIRLSNCYKKEVEDVMNYKSGNSHVI